MGHRAVSKYCWENGARRLTWFRVATNLQFIKNKQTNPRKKALKAQYLWCVIKRSSVKWGMPADVTVLRTPIPSSPLMYWSPIFPRDFLSISSTSKAYYSQGLCCFHFCILRTWNLLLVPNVFFRSLLNISWLNTFLEWFHSSDLEEVIRTHV